MISFDSQSMLFVRWTSVLHHGRTLPQSGLLQRLRIYHQTSREGGFMEADFQAKSPRLFNRYLRNTLHIWSTMKREVKIWITAESVKFKVLTCNVVMHIVRCLVWNWKRCGSFRRPKIKLYDTVIVDNSGTRLSIWPAKTLRYHMSDISNLYLMSK